MTKTSILAAALLAASLPAAAHAELVVKHVRVYYGDLDLDVRSDAMTMLARIDKAAKRACRGLATGPIEFQVKRVEMNCRAHAVDKGVADLAAPEVSLAHARRIVEATEFAAR
jgi:UrcA family protein